MHPYLFFIGDFPVRSYGLVLSLSIILATGVAYFLAREYKALQEHIVDLGIYCGIAGLLGARLWDVFFFDWDYYRYHITEIFNVWQGGMAIQGGVVLGVITGIFYAKRQGIDILRALDIVAPAIVLGQSLGRCANLLNGDAFGTPTGTSFGILYPSTSLAYHTYGDQPLWPAEVWEGQLDIVIFALLLLFRSFPHTKGQTFTLYVMLYSVVRFSLEYLRGDYTNLVFGLFTSAQTTSLIGILFSLAAFLYLGWKGQGVGVQKSEHIEETPAPRVKRRHINK